MNFVEMLEILGASAVLFATVGLRYAFSLLLFKDNGKNDTKVELVNKTDAAAFTAHAA